MASQSLEKGRVIYICVIVFIIIHFEIIMAWELKWFCMRLLFALDTLEGWSFPLGEAVFLLHCGNVCSPTRGSSTEPWKKEIYIYTGRCCIFMICNLYNLYDFVYVFAICMSIFVYIHIHIIYINIHLRTVYLLMILFFREGWCLGAQHLGVSNWCRSLGGNQHVLFRPFWDEVQSVSDSCVFSCCLDRLGEYPTWCEKNHHLASPLLQKPLL